MRPLADAQKSKLNLEVQTGSCFSQQNIKIDLKQKLNKQEGKFLDTKFEFGGRL
jgi:hypothetical protein